MTVDEDEVRHRLAALDSGPWMRRGNLARRELLHPNFGPNLQFTEAFDLVNLAPFNFAPERVARLHESLRSIGKNTIQDRASVALRDSLDSAFTHLELVELAIECGYVPPESVANLSRNRLGSLLWSQPVQAYVRTYAYRPLQHLANRVGVHGLSTLSPPNIHDTSSLRFAAFLACLREIETDPDVRTWISVLENQTADNSTEVDFLAYLLGNTDRRPTLFLRAIAGARRYIVLLADFFATLPADDTARFGDFYAYWFSRLFDTRTSVGTDAGAVTWAGALNEWITPAEDSDEQTPDSIDRALLKDSMEILRTVWLQHAQRTRFDSAPARYAADLGRLGGFVGPIEL